MAKKKKKKMRYESYFDTPLCDTGVKDNKFLAYLAKHHIVTVADTFRIGAREIILAYKKASHR